MLSENIRVFSTQSYTYLQKALTEGFFRTAAAGKVFTQTFPDGERYLRVLDDVDGRDVVLIGGTISDSDTLELYDLASALVENGARSLTLVIPYFGYSTMERAVHPGEAVVAKARARLLSSLPPARYGNRVVLFDLHSEGLPYYFEGGFRPFHLYGKKLIMAAAKDICPDGKFVLASTDAGRAKWVESLANDLNVPAAFVFKRRLSGDKTEVAGISAEVEGKHVIIYDDMIRTGGSLCGAAKAYMNAGASKVSAIATHGIFPGDSFARLKATNLFSNIVCTDSHPNAVKLAAEGLRVADTSLLIEEFLATHPITG